MHTRNSTLPIQIETRNEAAVISIVNMKGGVGKTTLSSNLAVELSAQNKKVLIIDLDPQFNTTQVVFKYYENGMSNYFNLKSSLLTISTILAEKSSGLAQRSIGSIELKDVIYKINENLDIIPGDLSLTVDTNMSSAARMKGFFRKEHLKESYDYIIIDCPPTWGSLTTIALELSNFYLIPTKLDEFSTIGITILSEKISELQESLDHPLFCLGVAYMMTNKTTARSGISREQSVIKEVIEEFFEEIMQRQVESKVIPFDTAIPNLQTISHKSSIYASHLEKHPRLQANIKDLISEIESRIRAGDFAVNSSEGDDNG